MSDYSKAVNFLQKDALATGNSAKIVKGAELDVEFNALSTAIATKVDEVSVSSAKILKANGTGGIADSGVTTASLNTLVALTGAIPPTGAVMMWSTASAPSGWLLCDGTNVSRTTYSDLFGVLSTTYGAGDGSTTFGLPDTVGRTVIGSGTGDASDATAHNLATEGGTEGHSLIEAELAAHTHPQDATTMLKTTTSSPPAGSDVDAGANPSVGGTTQSTGSGNAHNNLQPYLTLNYIIKT